VLLGKIRDSLIGANKLIDEVNTGAIQPFGTIDDKRMKNHVVHE